MDQLNFTGKNVLVVGGSSGIGNGIAQSFRRCGAKVWVWGTKPTGSDYKLEDGSDLRGLEYSRVDVSDRQSIADFRPAFDSLDVLVLSQGTVIYKRGEFTREGWDKVMAVNLDSLLECSTKFKDTLSENKGSIIIISSISGFQANIGNPAYAASKAGAMSLTRVLGKAWARSGIRVNGIAPGLVDTQLTKVTTQNPERLAAVLSTIPANRKGEPEDMGNVALFLASPLASYMVGQTLVVDGGLSLT